MTDPSDCGHPAFYGGVASGVLRPSKGRTWRSPGTEERDIPLPLKDPWVVNEYAPRTGRVHPQDIGAGPARLEGEPSDAVLVRVHPLNTTASSLNLENLHDLAVECGLERREGFECCTDRWQAPNDFPGEHRVGVVWSRPARTESQKRDDRSEGPPYVVELWCGVPPTDAPP
jgi:hypothetical protein